MKVKKEDVADPYKEIAECEALLRSARPDEKASIYVKMGDIYSRMKKKVKAQIYFTQAMEAGAKDFRDIEKIAQSLLGSGEAERAEGFVNENMPMARSPLDKARLLTVGAQIDWRRSYYDESRKKGALALELMKDLKGPDEEVTRIRAECCNVIGSAFWEMGEILRSHEMYRQSLEHFMEIDDQKGIGRMYNNLGLALMGKGEFKEALEMLAKAFEMLRRTGAEDGGGTVLNNVGYIHLYMGELDEANRDFKEGIKLCKGYGFSRSLTVIEKNIADLYSYKNEPIKAKKWAEMAIEEARELKSLPREARAICSLAMALQVEGDLEQAERLAEKAVSMTEGAENPDLRAISLRVLGAIRMERGDLDGAERMLRKAFETTRPMGDIVIARSCQLELALALKAKGDIKGAMKLAEEVRGFFGQWGEGHFLIKRLEQNGL